MKSSLHLGPQAGHAGRDFGSALTAGLAACITKRPHSNEMTAGFETLWFPKVTSGALDRSSKGKLGSALLPPQRCGINRRQNIRGKVGSWRGTIGAATMAGTTGTATGRMTGSVTPWEWRQRSRQRYASRRYCHYQPGNGAGQGHGGEGVKRIGGIVDHVTTLPFVPLTCRPGMYDGELGSNREKGR